MSPLRIRRTRDGGILGVIALALLLLVAHFAARSLGIPVVYDAPTFGTGVLVWLGYEAWKIAYDRSRWLRSLTSLVTLHIFATWLFLRHAPAAYIALANGWEKMAFYLWGAAAVAEFFLLLKMCGRAIEAPVFRTLDRMPDKKRLLPQNRH